MNQFPIVAIDGPAAVGKSTVSHMIAHHLGIIFVSSGELYRSVAWSALESGISTGADEMLRRFLFRIHISVRFLFGKAIFLVNGVDCTAHLHSVAVQQHVSLFSRVPAFRQTLLKPLRDLGKRFPLVMEGRDIGSVVFPETPYKFYLDASKEARQYRRRTQGIALDVIGNRDQLDANRAIAPLITPAEACCIDTTCLTKEVVVWQILHWLKLRGFFPPEEI